MPGPTIPAYVPKAWVNDSPVGPYMDADYMTAMEQGIKRVTDAVNSGAGVPPTVDTSAIQAALTACGNAGGGIVELPPGAVTITTSLTVPGNVRLRGAGRNATRLIWQPTTGDAVTLAGAYSAISDLTIQPSISAPASGCPTSGALLVLAAGALQFVQNVNLNGGYDLVRADDAYGWIIQGCYFTTWVRYGIFARSLAQPDRGDSSIVATTLDTATIAVGSALRYESGGGLKLSAVKILHGAYGIDLAIADGASTSILTVAGCSIENQSQACVRIGQAGTTGVMTEIVMSGSQFNGVSAAQAAIVLGAGVQVVAITGNTIKGTSSTTGILLAAAVTHSIVGNIFLVHSIGISRTASAQQTAIGENLYASVTTPVLDDSNVNVASPVPQTRRLAATVTALTSTSAYTNVARVELNQYRSAVLSVTFDLVLNGVGRAGRHVRAIVGRDTAGVVVTSVSDTATGAALDLAWDTTTTAGVAILQVRRNSAANGSQLDGTVTVVAEGGVRSLRAA